VVRLLGERQDIAAIGRRVRFELTVLESRWVQGRRSMSGLRRTGRRVGWLEPTHNGH
jgi:hypothetical protein